MELKELIKTIDPNKQYSLKGAMKIGVFKETLGCISYPPCLNFVLRDRAEKNGGILKTDIVGEGRRTLYIMRGQNIINFLKKYAKKNEEKKDN